MQNLKFEIHNIKNIKEAILEIPFENGVYTIVGPNGCGKSTLMLCLAQILSGTLNFFSEQDCDEYSKIRFSLEDKELICQYTSLGCWKREGSLRRLNGMYEGSLFYGTRFEDSTKIERQIFEGKITNDLISDADDYIKVQMSYILHGDKDHYKMLKRIKNGRVADRLRVKNRPYFIQTDKGLISQYRMSSGECLLVSLLHFLYNSIERRSLPPQEKVLVVIDEIELALHPLAIVRLMSYLHELVREHDNLIVYLSSHSPEVLRTSKPCDLFLVNNENGILTMESNCYPSYLIRDLYSNVSPDILLLVEDRLAELFVNRILSFHSLRVNKLIHCVPVGGWKNVLELHREFYQKKILGNSTRIISVLDGDVENELSRDQKKFPHLFLPIQSVEKFLYSVIVKKSDKALRKIINDKYFLVDSLDLIVSDYNGKTSDTNKDNNKNFYKALIKVLESSGTSEETFVNGLCDDIIQNVNTVSFVASLKSCIETV